MTVTVTITLTDEQEAYARWLVEEGIGDDLQSAVKGSLDHWKSVGKARSFLRKKSSAKPKRCLRRRWHRVTYRVEISRDSSEDLRSIFRYPRNAHIGYGEDGETARQRAAQRVRSISRGVMRHPYESA